MASEDISVRHRVVISYGFYGCDTGCTGHRIELVEGDGEVIRTTPTAWDTPDYDLTPELKVLRSRFDFRCPVNNDEKQDWAKGAVAATLGHEFVDLIDFEASHILAWGEE